jgi:hypothetical protein
MLHITTPDCIVGMFVKSCIVHLVCTLLWEAFVLFLFCFVGFLFFFIYFFLFFNFGNADLFCLILQLGWCCHSDVCGIPHCVPEVHGQFYAWPHQDKSHPLDGRVSSRTCNLFWLPGDSDSVHYSFVKLKVKAVLLQAWSGPEGSRNLRFPDFMTMAHDDGKVVSLMHRPPLPPRKYTWYSFL